MNSLHALWAGRLSGRGLATLILMARARRHLSEADLARVARLVACLRRQPVRWSWR